VHKLVTVNSDRINARFNYEIEMIFFVRIGGTCIYHKDLSCL